MAWEIFRETLLAVPEATRRTPVTPPTHLLSGAVGKITPTQTTRKRRNQTGTRMKNVASTITRRGSTWEFEGDVDVAEILMWLQAWLHSLTSPSSTPTNGILTRLWTFIRLATTDAEKALTFYWGDPEIQVWQSAGNMAEEFTLENDAQSDDGILTFSTKGQGLFPTEVADPTVPASIAAALLIGAQMQCWIHASSFGGGSAITDRLLSSKLTVPIGRKFKRVGAGPTAGKGYNDTGVEKSAPMLELTFEVPDKTQYDHFVAGTLLFVRVQHNGDLIESVTPDYYNYVQHDLYGQIDSIEWNENQGSNRTLKIVIEGLYEAGIASDLRISVQNKRTTL